MRIELHGSKYDTVEDIHRLCKTAIEGRAESVLVPADFVSTAVELIPKKGPHVITEVCGQSDKTDTKIMGLQSATQDGADQIIVSLSDALFIDGRWDVIEKEITLLHMASKTFQVGLWLRTDFNGLEIHELARIFDLIPDKVGVRLGPSGPNIVKMATLCAVKNLCSTNDVEGITHLSTMEIPEQEKTTEVYKTEVHL